MKFMPEACLFVSCIHVETNFFLFWYAFPQTLEAVLFCVEQLEIILLQSFMPPPPPPPKFQ